LQPGREELILKALDVAELVARLTVAHFPPGRRHLYPEIEAQARLLLVEAAGEFDPSTGVPFRRWAKFYIARRIVDSIRRRKMRDANHISLEVLPGYLRGEADQEVALERARSREMVQRSLGLLDAREADIIIRFYYLGQTLQEIAKALAIGATTVSRLKRAALARLGREMERSTIRSCDGPPARPTPP
jgi:RNA polymerase sigma factor (sigma-70 family)